MWHVRDHSGGVTGLACINICPHRRDGEGEEGEEGMAEWDQETLEKAIAREWRAGLRLQRTRSWAGRLRNAAGVDGSR